MADWDTVFGTFEAPRAKARLRSHGSRHESAVPIIAWGRDRYPEYSRNCDVVAGLDLL